MDRETRANLIFIVVLVALSLPGAVILFRKKLAPEASVMGVPDAVRQRAAYNDPKPLPAGYPRVSPPLVRQWVGQWAGAPATASSEGSWLYVATDPAPMVSDGRRFEVLSMRRDGEGLQVRVLVWGRAVKAQPEGLALEVVEDKLVRRPVSLTVEERAVPEGVREALREEGYTVPPREVTVVEGRFGVMEGTGAGQVLGGGRSPAQAWLVVRYASATGRISDGLVLPVGLWQRRWSEGGGGGMASREGR